MVADILSHLKMYQALGWPVFPCRERPSGRLNKDGKPRKDEKAPLTNHGFKDASLDPDQIARWVEQYPGCAWGTPTSAALARVDIDPRNGGNETWEALIREHGDLPPTPLVDTGSGGRHYLLRFPDGTECCKLAPGVDLKASGGYVLIPPSRIWIPDHHQPYRHRVAPWLQDVADAPEWLVQLATSKPTAKAVPVATSSPKASGVALGSASGSAWVVEHDADLRTHPGVPEGTRRVTLCRLVGTHLARGDDPESVWEWAEEWASRCEPPFEDWEIHTSGLIRRQGKATAQHHQNAYPLPSPPVGFCRKEGINSGPGERDFIPNVQTPGKEGINSGTAESGGELIPSFPVAGESKPGIPVVDPESRPENPKDGITSSDDADPESEPRYVNLHNGNPDPNTERRPENPRDGNPEPEPRSSDQKDANPVNLQGCPEPPPILIPITKPNRGIVLMMLSLSQTPSPSTLTPITASSGRC